MKMTNTNQMTKPYYFFHNLWLIGSMKTVLFIQWDKRNFWRQNLNCWSLWKVLSNPQEIRFKSDLHIYLMKFCGDVDLKIWWIIGNKNSVKWEFKNSQYRIEFYPDWKYNIFYNSIFPIVKNVGLTSLIVLP